LKRRALGQSGATLPVIGQGTWRLEASSRGDAVRALRRGFELGMTHVDTAEVYGRGVVEEIVGEAIAGRRAEVFVTSKVQADHATYAGVVLACERSLRRLRTDHIDLYLLHRPSEIPFTMTLRALQTLRREGKIRHIGVSNFDIADLEEACGLAEPGEIVANELLYHLGERDIEHVLLPMCERLGVAVVGASPFASGELVAPSAESAAVLADIASDHRVSPRAVALAFLVRRGSLFTVPKAATLAHVEENAAAGAITLSEREVVELDLAFPLGAPRSRLPTV
jgi:diketogulonate reductase-like aldo/keto reductase